MANTRQIRDKYGRQLSYIVSVREKLRKGKKLDKSEREWYQKNRHMVDFKPTLNESEKAILKEWGCDEWRQMEAS